MTEAHQTLGRAFSPEPAERLEQRELDRILSSKRRLYLLERRRRSAGERTVARNYVYGTFGSAALLVLFTCVAFSLGDIPLIDTTWSSELDWRTFTTGIVIGVLGLTCAICSTKALVHLIRLRRGTQIPIYIP